MYDVILRDTVILNWRGDRGVNTLGGGGVVCKPNRLFHGEGSREDILCVENKFFFYLLRSNILNDILVEIN